MGLADELLNSSKIKNESHSSLSDAIFKYYDQAQKDPAIGNACNAVMRQWDRGSIQTSNWIEKIHKDQKKFDALIKELSKLHTIADMENSLRKKAETNEARLYGGNPHDKWAEEMGLADRLLNEAESTGQIVWAWVDMQGREATGRERHIDKYNRGPEFKAALMSHAAMYLREGDSEDLEKAHSRIKKDGSDYECFAIFVYSFSERDPLGKAKDSILQMAKKGKRGDLGIIGKL